MTIFTSDAQVIKSGTSYLRVISLSYLFYGLTSTFLVILRSVETVNICLKIYLISFVVNVVFKTIYLFLVNWYYLLLVLCELPIVFVM